jgi:glucokinase
MNPNTQYALGIDIGGSHTKMGLVSKSGEIFEFNRTKTDAGNLNKFLDELIRTTHATLEKIERKVLGIGVSVLGWLNDERSYTFFCMNFPSLNGYPLQALLEKEFGLPVIMNEDLVAHNLAEFHWGAGNGFQRFLTLALGTGVGASMIINGKPLKFTGGCAGDTGHIILRPDGPVCPSGCRGCGEALIGSANIERMAEKVFGEHYPASEIIRKTREASDQKSIDIIREIGIYTGELLASLAPIFLPERIALTGGTTKAGPILLNEARARFEELVGDYHRNCVQYSFGYYRGVDIVFGSLEGETGVLGSVVEFFDRPH